MIFESKFAEQSIKQRDSHLSLEEGKDDAERLSLLLDKYKDKRVLIIAPPCSGKSTLKQHLKNCIDMDIIFDTMPEDFKKYVLHHEDPFMFIDGDRKTIKYTEKKFISNNTESEELLKTTADKLEIYTNNNFKIIPGQPVFGASLIDADVVIYLKLSEEALNSRILSRNKKTHRPAQGDRVFAISKLIEQKIEIAKQNGIIVEEFKIS